MSIEKEKVFVTLSLNETTYANNCRSCDYLNHARMYYSRIHQRCMIDCYHVDAKSIPDYHKGRYSDLPLYWKCPAKPITIAARLNLEQMPQECSECPLCARIIDLELIACLLCPSDGDYYCTMGSRREDCPLLDIDSNKRR
jgi:hypothetical protein